VRLDRPAVAAAQLRTVGTANNRSQTSYEILVRPVGARTEIEQDQGVVQSEFLPGAFGGITLLQWRLVQRISGGADGDGRARGPAAEGFRSTSPRIRRMMVTRSDAWTTRSQRPCRSRSVSTRTSVHETFSTRSASPHATTPSRPGYPAT
jgi:hypothetical protein